MKNLQKFISCVLAIVSAFIILMPANHIHADTDNIISEYVDADSLREEKIFSKATVDNDFADDKVVIIMKHSESMKFKKYSVSDFSEVDVKSVTDIMAASTQKAKAKSSGRDILLANGDTIKADNDIDLRNYRQIIVVELEQKGKQNVLDAIKLLENRDDILYVGPELYVEYTKFVEIDDYHYNEQWAPEIIELPEAFEEVANPALVRVGVLDTGVDYQHEDLEGRVNVGLSRDCVSGSCVAYSDSYPLRDEDGHGTQVASVIGAGVGNNYGMVGAALNVEIISLRVDVGYDDGIPDTPLAFSSALNYADQIDVPILNMSIGYVGNGLHESLAVIHQSINNYSGLIVCAAGNSGLNIDYSGIDYISINPYYDVFPAEYDNNNIISVGASTEDDGIANFSNYGNSQVDIFAPGESIFTCNPERQCDYHNNGTNGHVYHGYHSVSGTSFAAPYVTGVAALVLSKCPNLTANELKTTILNSADTISDMNGKCVSGGRLNAYNAITNIHHDTFDYITSSGSDNTHNKVCSTCGTVNTEAHIWTGECQDYGSLNTHYVFCVECGDRTTESHNNLGSYESYDSNITHYVYCTKCGGKSTEAHNWVEQPAMNNRRCSKCRKTSTGNIPIIKPTAILSLSDEDE